MKLIITEKPSVAKSIASALGAKSGADGYFQGNALIVSWCVGHLVSPMDAAGHDERFKKWRYDDLPILPEPFRYVLAPGKEDAFENLRVLMDRPDVDTIVNACDAGREGELIFRLVQTLCPKKAVIPAPSFMEYETALKACGTEVSFFYLKESESFFLNVSEYLEFLKKERPDMIFLCTPANPTGAMMRKADLLKILDYCKRAGIVAVIDECFIEFLNEEKADGCIREFLAWKEGMPENGGTLFLLRAFTKTYAMAGLRIGYGFCTDPGLVERMEENWQPWSVSIPAQEAGLAALSDERIPFLKKMRELVEKERNILSDGLTKAGFTVFHSEANFLLFKDFKTEQESWLYEFFLEHGILIRPCKNYRELDSRFYRICVRTHEENLEFLEILKEYR